MKKFDKIDKNIRSYMLKTCYKKWTKDHSKNKKYSVLTSNIAKSMNAANKATRDLCHFSHSWMPCTEMTLET